MVDTIHAWGILDQRLQLADEIKMSCWPKNVPQIALRQPVV